MNNNSKITFGVTLSFMFFCISKGFGQTNFASMTGTPPDYTGDVIAGIWKQSVSNPSSFFVIGPLMVLSWLCDDFTFINSKFVKHITVITGMSIYWAFANPETVSKIYPHPLAIYISNGCICGAVAYIGHWQITNRLRALFNNRPQPQTQTT